MCNGQHSLGAKTVKAQIHHLEKRVRLISGRNSPNYSLVNVATKANPGIGKLVLEMERESFSN